VSAIQRGNLFVFNRPGRSITEMDRHTYFQILATKAQIGLPRSCYSHVEWMVTGIKLSTPTELTGRIIRQKNNLIQCVFKCKTTLLTSR